VLPGRDVVDVATPPPEVAAVPQTVSKTVTVLETKVREVMVSTDVQTCPY
jgi:hypothetical protein